MAASNGWFFAIEFGLFHIVSLYNDNKVVPLFLHTFWIAIFTTIVIVRESLLQGPITVTLGKAIIMPIVQGVSFLILVMTISSIYKFVGSGAYAILWATTNYINEQILFTELHGL